MKDRKLDTSATGPAGPQRVAFNAHLDACADCQPHLCHQGEALWRTTCLTALRKQHANDLADVVVAAPVAQGHPAGGAL